MQLGQDVKHLERERDKHLARAYESSEHVMWRGEGCLRSVDLKGQTLTQESEYPQLALPVQTENCGVRPRMKKREARCPLPGC